MQILVKQNVKLDVDEDDLLLYALCIIRKRLDIPKGAYNASGHLVVDQPTEHSHRMKQSVLRETTTEDFNNLYIIRELIAKLGVKE